MNKKNLQTVLQQYLSHFNELSDPQNGDEGFKWRAVRCFQTQWNPDAENFPEMFQAATREASVLLDNKSVQPVGGIRMLLEKPEEETYVRACFRELFAPDGGDLNARQEKLNCFVEHINERIKKYTSGSWRYPQKFGDALAYLNLGFPDENYLYKATEAAEWANCVEFGEDFGSGKTFSLPKYYRMCDELLQVLSESEIGKEIQAKTAEVYGEANDHLHLLVYDVIFCAHAYHFYLPGMVRATTVKERLKLAKAQEEQDKVSVQLAKVRSRMNQLRHQDSQQEDMTGQTVMHRVYGAGTVVSQEKGMHRISFTGVEKKFEYPKAYLTGFLKAEQPFMEQMRQAAERAKEMKTLKETFDALNGQLERLMQQ